MGALGEREDEIIVVPVEEPVYVPEFEPDPEPVQTPVPAENGV